MGNNPTKESRSPPATHPRPGGHHDNPSSPTAEQSGIVSAHHNIQRSGHPSLLGSRSGRGSRHDLSILTGGDRSERDGPAPETRRETRAEREARRLEKERVARENERERSMREECVDGGYLVTLGTYTGPEDFNKQVVRQLMIERRIAPFWKGLNDHDESWTEHQLVAAAKGLPLPAADEVPPESPVRTESSDQGNPRGSNVNINNLTVPISSRSQSYQSDKSTSFSALHPAFSSSAGPSSPLSGALSSSGPFRSRAKTLASLGLSSRNNGSQQELTPQELRLPDDPYVNGQRLEAYLYKDAQECPICFLYYPPWLNRTRCCDQPICSECFVQIKRPDPHPPEHAEPNNSNTDGEQQPHSAAEEIQLVSEPAACPFCVQPEFGVTYEAPPFRRGLVYPLPSRSNPLGSGTSAMSSSTSLSSMNSGMRSPGSGGRRRTASLSATAPGVITTDRVRPDWAKKLADARAQALRRSVAATALHNAAFVLGNAGTDQARGGLGFGRRRRTLFGDSPNSSGLLTPRLGRDSANDVLEGLLEGRPRQRSTSGEVGVNDMFPDRHSSRRLRTEDLEELMMMEAIRLSLAAEEERKRKADKEAAKEAKKEEKRKRKEDKKAGKASRKSGLYPPGANASVSSTGGSIFASGNHSAWSLGGSDAGSKSKGIHNAIPAATTAAAAVGFNPLSEPTSTLNTELAGNSNPNSAQHQHHPSVSSIPPQRSHLRQMSTASSSGSSLSESNPGSVRSGSGFDASSVSLEVGSSSTRPLAIPQDGTLSAHGQQSGEDHSLSNQPMFNFSSLAAVMDQEPRKETLASSEHREHGRLSEDLTSRSRGGSGESSSSNPPIFEASPMVRPDSDRLEHSTATVRPEHVPDEEEGSGGVLRPVDSNHYDVKHFGDDNVRNAHKTRGTETTQ